MTTREELISALKEIKTLEDLKTAILHEKLLASDVELLFSKLPDEDARSIIADLLGLPGRTPKTLAEIARDRQQQKTTFFHGNAMSMLDAVMFPRRVKKRSRMLSVRVRKDIAWAKLALESYDSRFNPFDRGAAPQNLKIREIFTELTLRSRYGTNVVAARRAISVLSRSMSHLQHPRPDERYCDELCYRTEAAFVKSCRASANFHFLGGKVPGKKVMIEIKDVLALFGRAFGDVDLMQSKLR